MNICHQVLVKAWMKNSALVMSQNIREPATPVYKASTGEIIRTCQMQAKAEKQQVRKIVPLRPRKLLKGTVNL